jgi:integrase
MLRVSEYTSPTQQRYDPTINLTPGDITFTDNFRILCIRLKASKTDPFRLGVTVRLGATNDDYCPVLAMAQYLAARPQVPGPVFVFRDSTYLTRCDINNLLTNSLAHLTQISTHSFRKGGASHYLRAGMPENIIQLLGRWRSDAYKIYISIPNDFIRDISHTIASFAASNSL